MLKRIPLELLNSIFFFLIAYCPSDKLEISVLLLPPPVRYWESKVCPGELAMQQDSANAEELLMQPSSSSSGCEDTGE